MQQQQRKSEQYRQFRRPDDEAAGIGPDDVSVVAPFRYSIVVFAFVLGIVVFGELPDAWSLAGIGLIVAAGLYMLHREAVRRRLAATSAAG